MHYRKRPTASNSEKVPKKTRPFSTANASAFANNDDRKRQHRVQMDMRRRTNYSNKRQASPPPKKRMVALMDVPMPVSQEKQQEPVNKQPLNVLMQDLVKTMENYDQFKKEMERIQKHGTSNFVVTNEFAEKIKAFSEKASALNGLIPASVNIKPIRRRVPLSINNCRELFTKDNFSVRSTSIELVGFTWFLEATGEKGFLALHLHAVPPSGFYGNYEIQVDYRISILNVDFAGKDLIKGRIGQVYTVTENNNTGWGFTMDMLKLEDLLDKNRTFLTPEGDIETWVDFTIKSSTLEHLI